jgi:hydrogenase maturation protease
MTGAEQPGDPPITMVIGYGNELRCDDAAGPRVVREVQRWGLPHVRALVLHQLSPELAPLLAEAAAAIFVDAYAARSTAPVPLRVHTIHPYAERQVGGHAGDPRALLALAATLYGHAPPAWWVKIPAYDFAHGTNTSRLTQRAMRAALRRIFTLANRRDAPHGEEG